MFLREKIRRVCDPHIGSLFFLKYIIWQKWKQSLACFPLDGIVEGAVRVLVWVLGGSTAALGGEC